MPARNPTIACLMLSMLLCGAACAKRLDTFAGSIELPFDFHVKYRVDEASNGSLDFSASQRLRIAIDSGPMQGSEAVVVASYYVPAKGDARDRVWKPTGGDMRSVQVEGHPFVLYATDAGGPPKLVESNWHDDAGGTGRTTVLSGMLNNAMLTVSYANPTQPNFDASRAMESFQLDFASILEARSHFDVAARDAVSGRKMLTPTGEYTAFMTPRLYSTWTRFDADGRPVAARTSYSFATSGMWKAEHMQFGSACSLVGGQDPDLVARQRGMAPDSRFSKVVVEGAPAQARIGGLAATRVDSRLASTYSRSARDSDTSRWIAADRDRWYVFDFLASNGPEFERELRMQIDGKGLGCAPKPLLALGTGSRATP